MTRSPHHSLLYVGAFLVIFAVLYALYHAAGDALVVYYSALASSVCWFMGLFDPAVGCSENYLLYNGITKLVVVEGCDGITFVALIIAAVLPFPASWREKAIGIAWLVPGVLMANWLRLLLLAAIDFYMPAGFHFTHVYLFQPLMIALTLIGFLVWLNGHHEPAQ
jgi:exosortase/archaeosortase family protein